MSMDVTLNNVLEGTRQFFLGLPNQAKVECGAAGWMSSPGAEHGALTSPAPTSRPPSAAPPRPPSEPLEPEPHIIHKATVMREALEKRREQPEPEDDEEEHEAPPSPPRHVLLRPPPAPAPASEAAPPAPAPRTPDHYAPPRQPDPYAASRPPDHYARYHYDSGLPDSGRGSLGPPAASPQPAAPRHSPQQTYARLTNAMTPHSTARLRESPAPSPPAPARYAAPPHNDRVPPIHHPHTPPRSAGYAAPSAPAPASSHYARHASHYERHPSLPARKYDPQHAYPGYRPTAGSGPPPRAAVGYKHVPGESLSAQYAPRAPDRAAAAAHPADARLPSRMDYNGVSRSADSRSYHYSSPSTSSVRYVANATSSVPVGLPSSTASRTPYRAAPGPGLAPAASPGKAPYEYVPASHAPAAPAAARLAAAKSGLASQQARMTVSVTSIVNQMKETKQKRESPLDLSVKTVKNSADSSTTQDDVIDSATSEIKVMPMQSRSTLSLSSRHSSSATPGYVSSHKVDFAPDFHSQYRERTQSVGRVSQPAHPPPPPAPVRYNGGFEPTRTSSDHYAVEPRHHGYLDRTKYTVAASKNEYVPRIDLTRPATEERAPNSRVRDDRHFVIGERKRPAGPIVNNIPEKIVRYETWSADSRIERMNRSAREQHELMSRPVYNYSSHKRLEAVHSDPRRIASPYRDVPVPAPAPPPAAAPHPAPAPAPRYYPAEPPARVPVDYHPHHLHHPQYIDRTLQTNGRHVIQKLPNREVHPHHHHHLQHHHNNNQPLNHHSGVPADKRVLSILRNSLETKQTGFVEPAKLANHIPDLIVIDDADDCVEITDLTKEYDAEAALRHPKVVQSGPSPVRSHIIKMPKAVDSIPRDTEYQRYENYDAKSKSPENDVASRIRTKAELKVMPPPQENHLIPDDRIESDKNKMVPKSQKQHLFNQIREDSLRLESVIKTEKFSEVKMPEVKTEPMNIDEIERDAVLPIKSETCFETESITESDPFMGDDLDWATACESFVEQLQTGCHKKKPKRKRTETETEIKPDTGSLSKSSLEQSLSISATPSSSIVIKQEPVDEEDILPMSNQEEPTEKSKLDKSIASESEYPTIKKEVENSALEETIETEAIKNKHTDHVEKECEISDPKPQKEVFKPSNKEPLAVAVIVKPNDSVAKETLNGKINEQTNKHKEIIRTKKIKEASSKEREKLKPVNKLCKQEKFKLRKLKEKGLRKIKAIENKKVETTAATVSVKKEIIETEEIKTVIKEELESTDDDEPLIKSKLLKEKEKSDLVKYQLLKDLSEKSAYVKLECCNVDMSLRKSLDSCITPKENESQNKIKLSRHLSRTKLKSISTDTTKTETKIEKQKFEESSTDSDAEEVILASRLRLRKNIKTDDNKATTSNKTSVKSSPKKHDSSSSSCSYLTPVRKPGFGDGSDFHPGWEEELYKFKRSLRMPSRLIAIPRGGSRGPFIRVSESLSAKGSTSLPDLDPPSLSPAPSITRSAVTDDFYPRKPEKVILDSDLDSNSSGSVPIRLQYDSEASTSTVISSTLIKKKGSSIVDVLIQKCGKKEDPKRKSKDKLKEDISPKIIPKTTSDLLPTPSLGLIKNGVKGNLSVKKEKILEDIFYLGPFRKETVTAYRNEFINNTDGLIGATEEFSATVLKSRTRTESKVLKQRATIREVFGDNGRPMSAPPTCNDLIKENEEVEIKKENEIKIKPKSKKICKDKIKRRSSSIRDGLRSTALKRSDAKGRLLRLKKRNTLVKKVLTNKKIKDIAANKQKRDKTSISADDDKEKCDKDKDDKEKEKDEDTSPNPEVQPVDPPVATVKKRFKRIFGRRKLSSGFDYIRKKKKIIRKKDGVVVKKIRRPAVKPSPESVHDIHKEVKGWFINKSIGETHLHRAARLGYTDCVAYCLEKMSRDPSAKDNAGFTALHVAAARGHVRIARLLLQYGANVSAAAQGGIRPLHEAAENNHVEMIRLLLSYGADPLLGTYGGLTPVELADGGAAHLLQLHIADVQGRASDPWRFPSPAVIIDPTSLGCDALSSPPPGSPPPPETTLEFQCTEAPLPPFYSLRGAPGQPPEGLWCLLSDVTAVLQIKSKESLLKQIHCGSGSPRELLREIRTQEFLERAQCHQLLAAGEKVNVRASKVALVRVTDKLRQLLKVETVLVS